MGEVHLVPELRAVDGMRLAYLRCACGGALRGAEHPHSRLGCADNDNFDFVDLRSVKPPKPPPCRHPPRDPELVEYEHFEATLLARHPREPGCGPIASFRWAAEVLDDTAYLAKNQHELGLLLRIVYVVIDLEHENLCNRIDSLDAWRTK